MNLKYRSRGNAICSRLGSLIRVTDRSTEALRALDVLPKDTNPVSEERPVDQLSRDEMAEELRRLRDLQTTKPTGVKRERDPEVDEIIASARPVKIKREEP